MTAVSGHRGRFHHRPQDVVGDDGIEIADRLVRGDQVGRLGERAGHRDALALTAGQRVDAPMRELGEARRPDRREGRRAVAGAEPPQHARQHRRVAQPSAQHVAQHRRALDQLKLLEHGGVAAPEGAAPRGSGESRGSVHRHRALARRDQALNRAQQGCLARSAGADHRQPFPRRHRERVDGKRGVFARRVADPEAGYADRFPCHLINPYFLAIAATPS